MAEMENSIGESEIGTKTDQSDRQINNSTTNWFCSIPSKKIIFFLGSISPICPSPHHFPHQKLLVIIEIKLDFFI